MTSESRVVGVREWHVLVDGGRFAEVDERDVAVGRVLHVVDGDRRAAVRGGVGEVDVHRRVTAGARCVGLMAYRFFVHDCMGDMHLSHRENMDHLTGSAQKWVVAALSCGSRGRCRAEGSLSLIHI